MGQFYDVIIVGGGPGGSTTGALLRKYNPALKVLILEREHFPREHIGESQLPPIGPILNEMGVWDKVEAANFVIKLGVSYTWGRTTDPWHFGFIPIEDVGDDPRPAPFEGWRKRVALQVDRAIYDDILLKHAAELGCDVRQGTPVVKVHATGDRIDGLELAGGEVVSARYYIDASGNAAVLRRAMNVKVEAPTLLQNIAFWDYFDKPGMNKPILERGIIRIRIRSVSYGWVWYIALSDDRTSVGLVTPASYFKQQGKSPEELFNDALSIPPDLQPLLKDTKRTGEVRRTNDWSYVADRTYGANWFLCGEALGFADPILSAGMTLTHTCARHIAYTILELDRGEHDADWLRREYNETQRRRVIQHMKFADYWYSGNGHFEAIRDNCREIAKASGLQMTAAEAFRWLSFGGIDDDIGQFAIGGLSLSGLKGVQHRLSHDRPGDVTYQIHGMSSFKLKIEGATRGAVAGLHEGRIHRVETLERDGNRLVLAGAYGLVFEALQKSGKAADLFQNLQARISETMGADKVQFVLQECLQCLEVMVANKWVAGYFKHGQPAISMTTPLEGEIIYSEAEAERRRKQKPQGKRAR